MKESETVKKYYKVRLLDSTFPNSRIVEKILVTIHERYEATITTLENSKYLSKFSLTEMLKSKEDS
ncbi:hypothetical protein RDI58_012116 [Solanum bulbocastanum]|uniref:Uncharacterized protein n=1 Tax=Solanum bulbocastanum TaxID=147425 RepID=A0AAN8TTR6_SOLBU